jgi:hypothetical protein
MDPKPSFVARMGGRKFVMALVCILVGLAIELATERGLSPTFGSFLAAVLAAFSVTNMAVERKAMGVLAAPSPLTEPVQVDTEGIQESIRELSSQIATSQETLGLVVQAVGNTQKVIAAAVSGSR